MSRPVLVLNAGSSSLKYQVVDPATGGTRTRGHVERIEDGGFDGALDSVLADLREAGIDEGDLAAVGHRVVHGGDRFSGPTVVDDAVLDAIDDLSRLAPLHNPPAVAGIRAARAAYPSLSQVAVFDTAWFADLPAAAATYAIDAELAARLGIRRYGMHGTSHEYVAQRAADLLGRGLADLDLITLHLGNGASVAAVRGGRPVDTSMGLTPLEGLVMGTRAGDLDPGVVVHLLRHGDLDVDGLEDLLHHRSGLLGLSGHHDLRDVQAAMDDGDDRAQLAYDVYCHRIRGYVGAYLAVLGGADALVLTAGVGEHDTRVRADALAGLERLGIAIDTDLNEADDDGPRRISLDGSPVAVLVVPTNEELAIARQVVELLG
ncbi:MAG TPA: acetate kinase [Nocardioides sp.]|uniref:acetate/propionate family kinase n=1 Tax=Nocardioides sp. TaxID=35761 RepID=UPI002CFE9EA8|nr:acetate kinase [Nocardioides sp.]HTW16851.1 acetate kinase [Nocardioides sp.]